MLGAGFLPGSRSPNFWSGTRERFSGHFASREHELLRWSPGRSLLAPKMREVRLMCAHDPRGSNHVHVNHP